MSASSLNVNSYFFNPACDNEADSGCVAPQVPTSESYYTYIASNNLTTLSANTQAIQSTQSFITTLNGVVFTPILLTSGCTELAAPYVPSNATNQFDLPLNQPKLAIAPWTNSTCVEEYLSMGRATLVQAFVFFLPDQGDASPPAATDESWNLGDGGVWKTNNGYPVYAISSSLGTALMQQSSYYSGNLSTTPNSASIVSRYGDNGIVRLGMVVNLESSTNLPSLWIFLVIILAVLISLVAIVSGIMHVVQRRRRADLRRRVASGDVDLETLGIKRLLVPQQVLDKMPVYTYEGRGGPVTTIQEDGVQPVASPTQPTPTKSDKSHNVVVKAIAPATNQFDQPGCAICLDDFVSGESQVRELPCNHIYHPECVDPFLTQNSSLCPLCKKSTLPPGYCPTAITAAMVRRERMTRRAHQRTDRRLHPHAHRNEGHRLANLAHRARLSRGQSAASTAQVATPQREEPPQVAPTQEPTEPAPTQESAPQAPTEVSVEQAPTEEIPQAAGAPALEEQTQERQEWIQARIESIVGHTEVPQDPEHEEQQAPAWRRAIRRVFPSG